MSASLTYDFFRKAYLERLKDGEALPNWQGSFAVDMLIRELNRTRVQGADFSVYQFPDVDWSNFLGAIFGNEELRERDETGFESRVLNMADCKNHLRTFIFQIHNTDIQLALLDYFASDNFQEVLSSGYIIYRNCREAIQTVCASLIGEIKRSLHGPVATDLSYVVDELAEDAGDEPVNSEQDIKKIIASLPTKKMLINGKVVEIYQLPKGEEITPIGKLIASVNKGEVQARKADWKHLVQEGFRAENTSPMTFMYWMLDSLTDIQIRDFRVDALHTILENLPAYLQEVEASNDVQNRYKQDCKNLLHYFRQINYIIPYFDEAGRYWNEHREEDQMDVETYLYFRFLDRIDNLKEYLAFSQAHYVAIHAKTHNFIPSIVAAQSEQYRDKLEVEDIVSFCSSLYMAETTRQKFIAGWEKPFPRLTIDDFDWELRNRCFDFYIEHRIQNIRTDRTSNRRLRGPSTQECYECLMESEQQAYNRLKSLEHFRGSAAYAREWKPGTPDILAMTEFFLQYLKEKQDAALQEKQPNNSTFNQMNTSNTSITTPKNHCDFLFVIREYPIDEEYRATWLWQDPSKYISINWRDMQAILTIYPTGDYQKPRLWLREYLKNHPEVRINDWQEIFHEVRSLMLSYVEDFFRLNKEYRLFGHDYNWFADASLAEVEEWLHITCWEHAFHNYAVPSFEIPADAPASAAATSSTSSFQYSDAADYLPAENAFLWPLYTTKATDEDKQTFEDYLRKLCASKKKSLTKDIKNYLKAKEEACIIGRPVQQNTEYEWVKKFGYPYGNKAYYSA